MTLLAKSQFARTVISTLKSRALFSCTFLWDMDVELQCVLVLSVGDSAQAQLEAYTCTDCQNRNKCTANKEEVIQLDYLVHFLAFWVKNSIKSLISYMSWTPTWTIIFENWTACFLRSLLLFRSAPSLPCLPVTGGSYFLCPLNYTHTHACMHVGSERKYTGGRICFSLLVNCHIPSSYYNSWSVVDS